MSLNIHTVRCEALFASTIQGSEQPSGYVVEDAIRRTIRRLGSRGCAAQVAQEFGDHPDTAVARMCWAREQVTRLVARMGQPGPANGRPEPITPVNLQRAA